MKTDTLNTEQTNTQLNSPHTQGTLASYDDTDVREAGWAKNKFRKTITPPQEIVSISDFSAKTDFNNITEQVDDLIRIGQSGSPLNNLRSAIVNLLPTQTKFLLSIKFLPKTFVCDAKN